MRGDKRVKVGVERSVPLEESAKYRAVRNVRRGMV